MPTKYMPDAVHEALARPIGATVQQVIELSGKKPQATANWLSRERVAGRLFHGGGATGSPYFSNRAHCEAWVAEHPVVHLTDLLVRALAKFGKSGARAVQLADAMGMQPDEIKHVAQKLERRGECASKLYKRHCIYWPAGLDLDFDAEMAHRRAIDLVCSKRAVKGGVVRTQAGPIRMTHAAPVTVRNPDAGKPQGEADMSRARITVRPTPRGRFEPDPGFVGAFSLVGIGRSVTTGGVWA